MASSDNPPTDPVLAAWEGAPFPTPRMLIMTQLQSRRDSAHPIPQRPSHTNPAPAHIVPSRLSPDLLDVPLSSHTERVQLDLNIALALDNPAIYSSVRVFHCEVCNKAKFKAVASGPDPNPHPWARSINEVPLRQSEHYRTSKLAQCARSQFVCSDCFVGAITAALDGDFLSNIHDGPNSTWIRCPVPECNEFIAMPPGELGNTLLRVGGEDTEAMLTMKYERVTAMRDALRDIHENPNNPVVFTSEGLAEAAALHAYLQRVGIMKSFFDPCFETVPDEEGNYEPFTAGSIRISSLDRPHGDLTIPIFMKFFKRKSPKDVVNCLACRSAKCEIDCDIGLWLQILSPPESPKRFWGPWMWKVMVFAHYLNFKAREHPDIRTGCAHSVLFCRECMEGVLKSQLYMLGRDAPGNLACPQCIRKLSNEEIRLYASEKTLNRYELLLRRAAMASDPGYRECCMCDDASIYDINGDGKDQMIECVTCTYKMCFWHQAPWHEGLSCDDFDQMMENDGSFQDSKEWIKEKTKTCPGADCGTPIEKDDGCDHMTCANCGLNFCWECLAEWESVDDEVHDEGCRYHEYGVNGEEPRDVMQAPVVQNPFQNLIL